MRTIHRTIVSALVMSLDGKLLMGMKDISKGGVYADCWHIPGGGIDEDEDETTALKRELLEEVGIDISDQKISLVSDDGRGESEKTLSDGEKVRCEMSFHVYRVDLDRIASEVKIQLSDDLVKTEWVELSKLGSYKLTPPSLKLFSKLGWMR
jgi:nucleoside triphosphatase